MSISIIIITLNEEHYLPKLLEDIAKQTDQKSISEILVVDGGSTDDTKKVAESFADSIPIRFIRAPRKGWAQQKNYGVKQAKGNYILFLDADIRIPKKLVKNLEYLAPKHPDKAITPRVKADSHNPLFAFGSLLTFLYFKVSSLFGRQMASDQALFISQKSFQHIGNFDESILHGADLEFMARAKIKGVKLFIPFSPSVRASIRRFKEIGVFTLFFRYVRSEIHRALNGGTVSKDYIGYTRDIPVSRTKRLFKKTIFIIFACVITLFVSIEIIGQLYAFKNRNVPITWGSSFSIKYANELGIPWQKAYTAMLSDLHVKHVRVMTYWDMVEPEPGNFQFKDVDWQIEEAKKYDAKVKLTVGLRQPRWPECHQPAWAAELQNNNKTVWQNELDEYIKTTLQRYKNEPAIESIQLENEYMNRNFGECTDFSRERLKHELEIVRQNAPDKRVYITTGDQFGLPVIGPMGDSSGTSMYLRTYYDKIGYYNYWFRPSWYGARSVFTNILHGQPMIVSELQAEPWGPKATVDLPLEEQDRSMSAAQMQKNFEFARKTGIKEIYTWGVEWWYWRMEKANDPSIWNEAKKTFENK